MYSNYRKAEGDIMAALDGKITIGIDYRPCMVHIPAKVKHKRNTSTNPGEYIIESPECEIKALFHCWDYRSELCDASPMIGGHPGGQVSGTFAIVEYEDGTVHEVLPTQIRFVDREIKNYAFCVDEKELEADGKQGSCSNS